MKKFWKTYFVIYCIIVILGFSGAIVSSKPDSLQFIDALLSVFSLWIVYAWAWQKPLMGRISITGNSMVSLSAYLIAFIILDFVSNFFMSGTKTHTGLVAGVLFYVIVDVPAYVAIFLYIRNFDKLMKQRTKR